MTVCWYFKCLFNVNLLFCSGCHQLFALAMAQSEASEVEGKRSRGKLAFVKYYIFLYDLTFIHVQNYIGGLFFTVKIKQKQNSNVNVIDSLSIILWLNLCKACNELNTSEFIFTIFSKHFVFKMLHWLLRRFRV